MRRRNASRRVNRMAESKASVIIVLFILVIAALAAFSLLHIGTGSIIPTTQGGVSISSLSHVFYQGINQNNFSGYYWLGQAYVNGGPNQFAISQSASSIASTTSGNLSGSTNIDNINIVAQRNRLLYPADGASGQLVLDTYSLQQYTGQFTVTNCNGQTIIVTGDVPSEIAGCLIGSGNPSAISSYENSCKTAVKGLNSTYIAYPSGIGSSTTWSCAIIKPIKYASLYQLGSAIYDQQVNLQFNTASITVNQSHKTAYSVNSTGKVQLALTLNPTANGGSGAVPSAQSIGVIYVPAPQNGATTPINQSSQLLSYSSFGTATNIGVSQNQAVSAISWTSVCPQELECGGVLNSTLSSINSQLTGQLSAITGQKSSYSGVIIYNSTNNLQVVLNDPNFNYITPQVTLAAGFPFMYITLAQATCTLQSSSSTVNFTSGATGTLNVKVQNSGPVAGDCSASVTSLPSPFVTQTAQQQQYLSSGQSTTFGFQVSSTQANQGGTIASKGTGEICNALNSCSTFTFNIYEAPSCVGNTQLLNGNCVPLTTITIPATTTVLPGQSSITSTIPAQSYVCQPPSTFNNTLFTQTGGKVYCWIPPASGLKLWELLLIIGIIIAIIVIVYLYAKGR